MKTNSILSGSEEREGLTVTAGPELTVNLESIIIGRELSGLTQTELAKQTNLSQAKISRIEDGISQPSEQEIEIIASALQLPKRFFYRSDVKRSIFNSFYRKRKSLSQKILMQFNAKVCLRQVQIDRLLSKVEINSEPVPRFDPDDYVGGIKQVAQALRQYLKLPPGPIKHFIRSLENKGIVVILEDFGIIKIDGVSTFTNNGTPIIFLNLHAPASRRRFSAAHEFAHTALHKYLGPDVDEQADALASELLMPEDEIIHDLRDSNLNLSRLAELKLKWNVSMAALLYRAKKLNVIEQRRYSYLFMKLSEAGYRIKEPHEDLMENEKATLEQEIIYVHTNELKYSNAEIAESLDISDAEVVRRYQLPSLLRVV